MGAPFRVLHVCTGNICRSPLAEHLMRAGLASRLGEAAAGFVVRSAGTHARTGAPAEPYTLDVLARRGVDGGAFRARELLAGQVHEADLVLTATRQHRAAVAALDPGAAARTFTLLELDRLVELVDPAALPLADAVTRARRLVPLALALRVAAATPGADDLPDPYRRRRRAFSTCADAVEAALQRPLDLLAPTVSAC